MITDDRSLLPIYLLEPASNFELSQISPQTNLLHG